MQAYSTFSYCNTYWKIKHVFLLSMQIMILMQSIPDWWSYLLIPRGPGSDFLLYKVLSSSCLLSVRPSVSSQYLSVRPSVRRSVFLPVRLSGSSFRLRSDGGGSGRSRAQPGVPDPRRGLCLSVHPEALCRSSNKSNCIWGQFLLVSKLCLGAV